MGFRIGQINDGGIRLLDWGVDKWLNLLNNFFEKRKSSLRTFRSGETETMIDYTLMDNKCRSSVKDVKVILGEEKGSQHCLLLMDRVFKKKVRKKGKFRKNLNLWRFRERLTEVKKSLLQGLTTKVMVIKTGVV